jgi:hypothetical protein
MNDAAVVTGLMSSEALLFFQNREAEMGIALGDR